VHRHTKIGKIAPGVPPKDAKTCCFPITNTMRNGHLSCIDLEHFWYNRHDRCAHALTVEKFLNFCAGVLQVPKTTENRYFRGSDCDRGTA